jgi:carbon storage regulator
MLVLRRRQGESILIGEEIEIQFLEVNSQAVKLGIIAPKHVSILRKELHLTVAQNRAASSGVDLERLADSLKKDSP